MMKVLSIGGEAHRHRAPCLAAWPMLTLILSISSCGFPIQQTDLQSFFEIGSSTVLVRSSSLLSGSDTLDRVPSGKTVTDSLVIINPKAFDIAYSLSWDVDDALFITPPPVAPIPTDATHISLSFVLDPAKAEHKTITFNLGMYVASINRHYDGTSLSLICDSPPNPVARAATIVDSLQKSVLALLLPTQTSDDDLAKLKITWRREGSSTSDTATYDIPSLTAKPNPDPFSSNYDCYFQASTCVAGYGYGYSVVLVDAAGQESSAVTTTSTANSFYLIYDGNGNTSGTAPASVGCRYDATATVAEPGDLAKTSYAFSTWNTAADGSGIGYAPGDPLRIPAGDLTLYAQWITNTTAVSFDIGTQALTFSMSSATLLAGSTLSVSCANAALVAGGSSWAWYVDGTLASSGSPSFSWTTANPDIGQHIISCTVTFNGISYSGSFRATVTQ
ncbi:MAG TPA: InlB B-repeat-containing protein [Rectinemataceae bacterium]|nr:InlB B-repeat-containing protein [Rectinemataceae bacterium]